ncbi:cytochrome P450 [Ceratobasidium sp. AG-I]|nr:cytochrome P450 [Ceratobasidium sp. AG-I]
MVGSIILHSVYGYEASPSNDSFVDLVESSVKHLCEAALPGNFYVNTIPWLVHVPSWFPGAGWKQTAKLWREEGAEVINRPFDFTKSQMSAGTAPPSMLKKMLTDLDTDGPIQPTVEEEEEMFRWVTATLFTAGADTSVSGLITFILAMVLYPEVQARARAEIDSVLKDGDRLPELSDKESMPYINCVIKEVLRWQSILPMGERSTCSVQSIIILNTLIPRRHPCLLAR